MPTAVFRADASASMGIGHAMRSFALAHAWMERGGRAVFAMAQCAPYLEGKIAASGATLEKISAEPGSHPDAELTAGLARSVNADWLVVDGYQFDSSYRKTAGAGSRLLVVDDEGLTSPYDVDIALNQNFHADERLYAGRADRAQLLLGPRYALIQPEFFKWREWRRENPPVARRFLVTMGGGDLNNVTRKVVEGLAAADIEGVEARVLIGVANPNRDSVMEAARLAGASFRVETNIEDMSEAMAWADIAVTAGGSSLFELALLRTPLIMITAAEGQKPVERALAIAGACPILGWHEKVSPREIAAQARKTAHSLSERNAASDWLGGLVDGYGAGRASRAMMSLTAG